MSKKKHRHPPRDTPDRTSRYMGMAWMWASMSKDPSTQVGAVVISSDNRPLGSGYNGPPKNILDHEVNWTRPDKYPLIVHAEVNALEFCSEKPRNATIYVTGNPCPDCMLDLVRAGLSKVVYFPFCGDSTSMLARKDEWEDTKDIAKKGNVILERFSGNINWVRDWVDMMYGKGVFD